MLSNATQYELWADLSQQNKHLRRNNWMHWSVHLLLVLLVGFMSYRPLTAIRVDTFGRATLVDAVQPENQPGPEEAQQVAQLIAQYLLEVNSGSVQRDLNKGLRLMTVDFANAYREKVKDDTSLAALEKGNIRTQLAVDGQSTEVKAQKDTEGRVTRYFVTQFARLDVFRADLLTTPVLTKAVIIRATMLVVPRTRATLNGLLVDFFEKEFLEDKKGAPTLSTTPFPKEKP